MWKRSEVFGFSVIGGFFAIGFSVIFNHNPAYMFFFAVGYAYLLAEALGYFQDWSKNQPPFKGWKYWWSKAFQKDENVKITKLEGKR